MTMKNKYVRRSRISEAKIREIVRYVAADLTALQAAALSGLNRNTVNRLYRGVRERMRLACEAQRRLFGVVEVDERGGPRNSDSLLRWDPDPGEGVWHATEETELSC